MGFENILIELVVIFAGSAVLATGFLYLKQPIILAYIVLGVLIGPWGFGLVDEPDHIEHISHVGIILLLFLLGLNLHPNKLYHLLRKTSIVTISTSLVFGVSGTLVAILFGIAPLDSAIVGVAVMFSSTVVSIKLTPTTALHQRHIGEMMTSVLLLQDIIAIFVIVLITGVGSDSIYRGTAVLLVKTILLGVLSFVFVKYVLLRLFMRFDVIQDYMFLASLGWCMLVAAVAKNVGLSYEIGAFLAGTSIASFPIALGIAEKLKPLREFFLILFFFSIGAQFNFLVTQRIILPGLVIAGGIILLKPLVFARAFRFVKEEAHISKELGVRLGQASEFSLLVAYSAATAGKIESATSFLIQFVVVLTFVVSTYWVVFKYPTPISGNVRMRRD